LNAVEAYLIVRWLGIDGKFMQLYAIDSVSCVIRMVLFVLPIGIGGQDWTITGLMMAHGFSDPVGASATLVTLKRGREFLVIAIGLVLLLVMPRRSQMVQQSPVDMQDEEDVETESIAAER
jgi:glycosyltransferase 2 family protein